MGLKLKFIAGLLVVAGVVTAYFCLKSKPIVVAVIDTGLDLSAVPKEAIAGPGYNFFDDNDDVTDKSGHGTAVTKLVLKFCPSCKVLPIKVTAHGAGIGPDDLSAALKYAMEKMARVVNVSFGMGSTSSELEATVKKAADKKIVIVTAAGAGISNPFKPLPLKKVYPQAYEDVIVVGVSEADVPNPVGNFGDELDFVLVVSRSFFKENALLRNYSSSSYTAAITSGIVGRFLKSDGGNGVKEARHWLRASTRPLNIFSERLGYGYLDIEAIDSFSVTGAVCRLYKTPKNKVRVAVSAVKDIEWVEASAECKRKESSDKSIRSKETLKKGRGYALMVLPRNEACRVKVVIKYNDNQEEVSFCD
ncbi:MAG: hypothetical protein A3K03_08175 [Bdellovibrionales bacterium RIFOXYD1_FULL_44_7]|nr:MAG: hypothetical protein A3K03_08175 [Bdellovibrionales bacterium RIFOXYD1_FULL_44_7]